MKPIFLLTILLLTAQIGSAQKLTRSERKIAETVSRNAPEAVAFLEKVVNINSGTLNLKGVREVGDVFGAAFEEIGFTTRWVPMPEEMNRAGHLFAETTGSKGRRLLLIGHLDTVFEEDSPFQEFKRVDDSLAHGPGANDMKGGDVIVLYALKALRENGMLDDAQIIVAFTGDEESTGQPLEISRRELIEAAKRSDVALGFETATGYDKATVARRGASGWEVNVKGTRAHSSGVFNQRVGAGAIFEVSRILNEFYQEVKGPEYLTTTRKAGKQRFLAKATSWHRRPVSKAAFGLYRKGRRILQGPGCGRSSPATFPAPLPRSSLRMPTRPWAPSLRTWNCWACSAR